MTYKVMKLNFGWIIQGDLISTNEINKTSTISLIWVLKKEFGHIKTILEQKFSFYMVCFY